MKSVMQLCALFSLITEWTRQETSVLLGLNMLVQVWIGT